MQKRNWYSEPDQLHSVNLAFETSDVFSDTSFETMSKHSNLDAVSDNVMYSEVINNPKSKELELIMKDDEDEEEEEEEDIDSTDIKVQCCYNVVS